MAVHRRKQFNKQPAETFPIDIDFHKSVPLGADNILSAVASAIGWPRKQPNNTSDASNDVLLSTTPALIGNFCLTTARIQVQGGTHNYDYKITVRATFDNGAILEEEIYMRVREE